MRPENNKARRIHIRVAEELLERIEEYRAKHAILNRASAIHELVRKGLEGEKHR